MRSPPRGTHWSNTRLGAVHLGGKGLSEQLLTAQLPTTMPPAHFCCPQPVTPCWALFLAVQLQQSPVPARTPQGSVGGGTEGEGRVGTARQRGSDTPGSPTSGCSARSHPGPRIGNESLRRTLQVIKGLGD